MLLPGNWRLIGALARHVKPELERSRVPRRSQREKNGMPVLYEGVSVITLWDQVPGVETLVAEDVKVVAVSRLLD